MRVLYVTWGEDLLSSGILENQVINQLIVTRRFHPEVTYYYLCGMPIFWKKGHLRHKAILNEKILRLRKAGIQTNVVYYWLPVRARHMAIVLHGFFRPFFFFWFRHFLQACQRRNIDVVHARAYTGAIVSNAALGFFRLKLPLIFDTRGLYVDELIQLGFLRPTGFWHDSWRRAEQLTYSASSVVVNVSRPFSRLVCKSFRLPHEIVKTIHTSVDTEIFTMKKTSGVVRKRRLARHAPELVYCGDLGGSSWHSTHSLFSVFHVIRSTLRNAKLTIISPASPETIASEVKSNFPNAAELISHTLFLRTYNASETAAILANADLALFSYHSLKQDAPQHLSDIVLGSKTGEYLATGLPVLVNQTAKAAAELIEQNKVGIVYDLSDEAKFSRKIKYVIRNWQSYSKRARRTAENSFSSHSNAQKYFIIYKHLTVAKR